MALAAGTHLPGSLISAISETVISVSRSRNPRATLRKATKKAAKSKNINEELHTRLVTCVLLHADLVFTDYLLDMGEILSACPPPSISKQYQLTQGYKSHLNSIMQGPSPTRPHHLQSIHPAMLHARSYSTSKYVTSAVVARLQKRADAEPLNVQAQYDYLKVLVGTHPQTVVQRVNTGLYAIDEHILKIYRTAEQGTNLPPPSEPKRDTLIRTFTPGLEWTMSILRVVLIAFVGVWIYQYFVKSKDKSSDPFGMNAVDYEVTMPTEGFHDVAGNENALEEMQDIVEFLTQPKRFIDMGCTIPKGVLLAGPPGVGKTLIARALAGEAGVPFFYASGSQFEEIFVGVGSSRVRKLFASAKEKAPSIIFIDEIDSIGRSRSKRGYGFHTNRSTLNQILSEMDGFTDNNGVIVIAATNDPGSLDEALTRDGRFDTKIRVGIPNTKDRHAILKVHTRNKTLDDTVDLESLASACVGMTGAQLATLVNTAALRAVHNDTEFINQGDLEFARERLMIGPVNPDMEIPQDELVNTAAHEAGHAILQLLREEVMHTALYVATIEPRGNTLGHVLQIPKGDLYTQDNAKLLAHIDVCFAGRIAEELLNRFEHNKVSLGCSEDMKTATEIAELLIRENGYSSKIGYVKYDKSDSQNALTDKLIYDEIKALLDKRYDIVKAELQSHEAQWKRLTEYLVQYKTLSGDEVRIIFKGGELTRGLPG